MLSQKELGRDGIKAWPQQVREPNIAFKTQMMNVESHRDLGGPQEGNHGELCSQLAAEVWARHTGRWGLCVATADTRQWGRHRGAENSHI